MNPQNMPRTIEIPNGQKVTATFSKQELSNRLAKLRAHMADANVDAVVLTLLPGLSGIPVNFLNT
mgnify:CR=1 FL=1